MRVTDASASTGPAYAIRVVAMVEKLRAALRPSITRARQAHPRVRGEQLLPVR